jgi:hypothetical protein
MTRNFGLMFGLLAAAGTGAAAQSTTITRSNNGANQSEIIQSGPRDEKATLRVQRSPEFVIIEQHSTNNKAVIIQGD